MCKALVGANVVAFFERFYVAPTNVHTQTKQISMLRPLQLASIWKHGQILFVELKHHRSTKQAATGTKVEK